MPIQHNTGRIERDIAILENNGITYDKLSSWLCKQFEGLDQQTRIRYLKQMSRKREEL